MTRSVDDPTDPLAVLGHGVRMDILRTLADAGDALSFTELRERVGVRDTGKFNYHLGKCCEYFVRETAEGYELGPAGSRVIASADAADAEPARESDGPPDRPGDDDACPVCGEADCGKLFHVHLAPPWRDG